jgi:hypothetical protein
MSLISPPSCMLLPLCAGETHGWHITHAAAPPGVTLAQCTSGAEVVRLLVTNVDVLRHVAEGAEMYVFWVSC